MAVAWSAMLVIRAEFEYTYCYFEERTIQGRLFGVINLCEAFRDNYLDEITLRQAADAILSKGA